jgi:hypothetical protein
LSALTRFVLGCQYAPGRITLPSLRSPRLFIVVLLGIAIAALCNSRIRGAAGSPATPSATFPAVGSTGVAANPTLSWTAAGATSYDVSFGTQNPPRPVWTGRTVASLPVTTAPGTKYFWRIVAKNSSGSTTGPVWTFSTGSATQPPPSSPLVVTCPSDQNATATDSNGSTVSFPAPTATGGTAPVSVVTTPTSGSRFPIGMTTVTARGTDAGGQQATCTFMVHVTSSSTPPPASTDSAAYGLWTPTSQDTCTKAQHDAYSATGPDGKRYPTWHPPTGPNGCTFGHEHGRNPSGSALLGDISSLYGGLLFGYANEALDQWNTTMGITNGMRHEDHVGHKVEWENDVTIYESTTSGGANRRALAVKCDFLMKIHQGTHSKDAFTNNMHELVYAMQCHDGSNNAIGSKVIVTKMVVFGAPGSFSEGSVAGGFNTINVGQAMPMNSPTGPGLRSLPTINRVLQSVLVPAGQFSQFSLGLYEDWLSANYIRAQGRSQELLYFDPHFAVFSPSRFYWPGTDPNTYGITRSADDKTNNLGRSVDVCRMQNGGNRARGGECDAMAGFGAISYDDPRSGFNGVHREFYFNNTTIVNPGSVTLWYTDPFGNSASAGTGPATIQQSISAVDNRKRTEDGHISSSGRSYPLESVAIGGNRSYGGAGIHAPD